MTVSKLSAIANLILQSHTADEEAHAVKLLSDFYLTFLAKRTPHPSDQIELQLQGGIALSFDHAADCLQDRLRTARFIKGVYQAIQELMLRFPDQKINVLYAGCGPFATILLPVLPLFKVDQLQVTLIDIHFESVKFVKELFLTLNLSSFAESIAVQDAISYRHSSPDLHMVITETMFHALLTEPQVAITANLAPQLAEGGIFIPEEVSVEVQVTSFAREPFLTTASVPLVSADYKRSAFAMLFSLNKDLGKSSFFLNQAFHSPWFKIPALKKSEPDICIFTRVRIFKTLELGLAESLITNPYCLVSMLNLHPGAFIRFIYNFSDIPSWSYQLK